MNFNDELKILVFLTPDTDALKDTSMSEPQISISLAYNSLKAVSFESVHTFSSRLRMKVYLSYIPLVIINATSQLYSPDKDLMILVDPIILILLHMWLLLSTQTILKIMGHFNAIGISNIHLSYALIDLTLYNVNNVLLSCSSSSCSINS